MFQLTDFFNEVAHKMPLQLVEPVEKMINKDVRYRPTARYFSMVSNCSTRSLLGTGKSFSSSNQVYLVTHIMYISLQIM